MEMYVHYWVICDFDGTNPAQRFQCAFSAFPKLFTFPREKSYFSCFCFRMFFIKVTSRTSKLLAVLRNSELCQKKSLLCHEILCHNWPKLTWFTPPPNLRSQQLRKQMLYHWLPFFRSVHSSHLCLHSKVAKILFIRSHFFPKFIHLAFF